MIRRGATSTDCAVVSETETGDEEVRSETEIETAEGERLQNEGT